LSERTSSAASGETTQVDSMGRARDEAYARFLAGGINEAEFIAIAASVMSAYPEAFIQWLDGYTLSRFPR